MSKYTDTPHQTIEQICATAQQRVAAGEKPADVVFDLVDGYNFWGSTNAEAIKNAAHSDLGYGLPTTPPTIPHLSFAAPLFPPDISPETALDNAAAHADWTAEVAAGDTVLGYEEWLAHKIEAERDVKAPRPTCVCDDCGWTGTENQLHELTDACQRGASDDIVPAGECPRCGSAAFIEPSRTSYNEVLAALKEAYAMLAPLVHKMSVRTHFNEKNTLENTIHKAIRNAEPQPQSVAA